MQSIARIFIVIAIIIGGAVGAMMYRKAENSEQEQLSSENQGLILQANQVPSTAPPVRVNGPIKELDKNDRLMISTDDDNRQPTHVKSSTPKKINHIANRPIGIPKLPTSFDENLRDNDFDLRSAETEIAHLAIRDLDRKTENPAVEELLSQIHIVVDGDTLEQIAIIYLGDRKRFMEIYQLNRDLLPSPNVLPIGAELRLPSRNAPAIVKPKPKQKDSHLQDLNLKS